MTNHCEVCRATLPKYGDNPGFYGWKVVEFIVSEGRSRVFGSNHERYICRDCADRAITYLKEATQ